MNRWQHWQCALVGFCCHVMICKSLHVNFHSHRRHRSTLQNHFHGGCGDHGGILALQMSFEGSTGDGRHDDTPKNIQGQESTKEGPFSTFRTAAIAFCTGVLAAVVFTMVLFHYTLYLENDKPFYQNAGVQESTTSISSQMDTSDVNEQKKRAVQLYRRILETLEYGYAEDLNPQLMFETTTQAMLKTLDPYTEYLSPKDLMKRQRLVGIGAFVMRAGSMPDTLDGKSLSSLMSLVPSSIELPNQLLPSRDGIQNNKQSQDKEGGYRVVLSLEGYAYDAGLRVGDEILAIDSVSVVGNDGSSIPTLEKVREMLTGAPGTTVNLTIKRPGNDKIQTITVERKPVQFPSVQYAGIRDGVGYIKLRRFGLDAGPAMQRSLLESIQSDQMKGLILDLRDNSGGELLSAVQIASLFFPEGTYLGVSDGKGELYPNETYRSGPLDLRQYGYTNNNDFMERSNKSGGSGILNDGKQIIDPHKTPIVILVNKRTASASELLAGVFQDYDKAVILSSDGTTTMGKGIGQREVVLPDGGALKLTYAKFYTPSGRCVQRPFQGEVNQKQTMKPNKKKTFHTTNGRTIHDGSGIEVDYKVTPRASLLNRILSQSGAYFQFSTEYASKHNNLPSDFLVSDSIYNDFKAFVLNEQRHGNLKIEKVFDDQHILDKVQLIAEATSSTELTESSLTNLREKIAQDLLKELDSCREVIRNELELNILSRSLSDSEVIGRSLEHDEVVQEAEKLIQDSNRYQRLLSRQN